MSTTTRPALLMDLASSLKKRLAGRDWTIPGLIVTLAALMIFFGIQSEHFWSFSNFLNIGRSISIRGVIAIGLTIVLISGGLDLSIAAVAAVAGMVAAMLIDAGMNGIPAGLIALAAAMVLGAVNSAVIVKLRINPIIATLATLLLFRGMAYVVSGGDNIVIGVNTWAYLGRGFLFGVVPVALLVMLGIMAAGILFMRYSVLGNYLYAIGGNSEACRNVGVKVDRIRFGTYMATALLSGIAGVILMSQGGTAQPSALDGAELDIFTSVLLGGVALTGGRGSLFGTLLGLFIVGVITNGFILIGLQIFWQDVARGVILILAVALDSIRRGGGYR